MLSVDAAFDRLDSALRQMGYASTKEESPPDPSDDRLAIYRRRKMAVRVAWSAKARMLSLQVEADGEWVDFAKRGFGPQGLEDTAVDALVRAIRNEVAETSTDPG